MIDYAGFATALEGEIKRLVALRDQVLAAYALPTGSTNGPTIVVTAAKPTKTRAKGLIRPGNQKPRRGLTPAEIEKAKQRWLAGESPTEIAKSVGKASTWCYTAAKGYGWPPRGSKKAGQAPKTKGVEMRRCPECRSQTPANVATCEACGEITG